VRRDDEFRGLFADEEHRDVHGYFAAHPELPPTPLRRLRSLAGTLDIDVLHAKDETKRFDVTAFKIAGVHYAVHRIGDEIAARGFVCATAGNHGRAVAKVARHKRIPCTVFVPSPKTADPVERATHTARVTAMREDDATVVDVAGTYEEALRQAAVFGAKTGATLP
jgi:diaminopropionate ammonia-lyase